MKRYLIIAVTLILSVTSAWAQSFSMKADFGVVIRGNDAGIEMEKETLTIYGYGYAKSANIKMSQNIAQANAQDMLAKQAAGNNFTFSDDNGVSALTINTAAVLQGVTAVSMDSPDGRSVILVSSTKVDVEKPVGEGVVTVTLDSSGNNSGGDLQKVINSRLDEMMRKAVKQAVNEAGIEDKTVYGTVYITNLAITF